MPTPDLQPEHAEPSEEELRRMLEAREQEKESQRNQLSRKLTKILLVAAVVLIGVILCFPSRRKVSGGATHVDPRVAELKAAILNQQNPGSSNIPDELKPFSVKPEQNSDHENVRFGMELLNFLQPPATPPSSGGSGPGKQP
ncbi:MAG: hypothetical protein V4819_21290 [Verrucomicrobiota bacterium]